MSTLTITTITIRRGNTVNTICNLSLKSASGVGLHFDCHPAAVTHEMGKMQRQGHKIDRIVSRSKERILAF